MQGTIEQLGALMLIAAAVAMIARRAGIPYTVALVAAGLATSNVAFVPKIALTQELIFTALLPPLIFEAAIALPWRPLRRDLAVILTIATVGVVLALVVTAAGMHLLAGWAWAPALAFGVLISATDPVSVVATFKEHGVGGRLKLLVEAESLFNDGTAAVAFGLVLAAAGGATLGPADAVARLLSTVVIGIGCGAGVALLMLAVAGRATDHLVEITFTTIAAWGSFLLAEHFHASGVLATLVAGLIIGNRMERAITDHGREAIEAFWEYVAFVANSLVFLMIGFEVRQQDFAANWRAVAVAIVVVLVGRMVAVYPLAALFSRSSARVTPAHQHLLVWGGLRGALALALALGLPEGFPGREGIVAAAFGVVAFSVLLQGLTMRPLLARLGELPSASRAAPR